METAAGGEQYRRIGKLRVSGGGDSGKSKENEAVESQTDSANYGGIADGTTDGAGVAHTDGILVRPTLGMDEPWRYRNKAQVPIGVTEGGLVGGFYARGSHRIIDMETCLIQHEDNDDVVRKVKDIGRELGISAYSEETGRGLLRHVVVKKAFRTGEMMVVLVTNGRDIPPPGQPGSAASANSCQM